MLNEAAPFADALQVLVCVFWGVPRYGATCKDMAGWATGRLEKPDVYLKCAVCMLFAALLGDVASLPLISHTVNDMAVSNLQYR